MNKAILIGNLTKDPELSTTQSGINYCRFTIGVTRAKSRDKETDFINITAWQKTAELCVQFLKKGSKVAIDGRIEVSSYSKDDELRYSTQVVADSVHFLGKKD